MLSFKGKTGYFYVVIRREATYGLWWRSFIFDN